MATKGLKGAFAALLLDHVRHVTLAETVIDSFMQQHNENTRILNFALGEAFVTNEELLSAIDVLLKKNGRTSYEQHLRDKVAAPDHTISRQAFAYALKHGEFTPKEAARIKFDCDTRESFERTYGSDDLKQIILRQLTTEKGPLETYNGTECNCC